MAVASAGRSREVAAKLSELYRATHAKFGDVPSLTEHSGKNSIRRRVDVFGSYASSLSSPGVVLDWGCRHAPDSCLVRLAFGDAPEIFGCDVVDAREFEVFHSFARLKYTKLDDPVRLPYENEQFDVVIASGVLEHCALVGESLKELYRVLREDGQLVITFLPNQGSLVEWIGRRIGVPHHRRLYSRRRLRHQLLDHGFEPTQIRFHQFIPATKIQGLFSNLWWTNSVLERTWPVNRLCTNIMAVATKHTVF